MLDPQQAAKRMAAAFHELALARQPMDACSEPVDRFKAARRRVTVLARIYLPLRDDAEFKAAYARELAALRGQDASSREKLNRDSGATVRCSS